MDDLDVILEDPRWAAVDLEALALRATQTTLAHMDVDAALAEVSLLGCDDARIKVLNADFREKPQATNVLSWPAQERASAVAGTCPRSVEAGPDGLIELGDIAISYDTCAAEAAAAHKSLSDHATHLIVHGVLHLLGYDHIKDKDATLMEGLEVEILGKMGLDDPYIEYSAEVSAPSK